MIWVTMSSTTTLLYDIFKEVYIDDEMVYKEKIIGETVAGEIKYGRRDIKEYYESEGKNKVLIKAEVETLKEPEVIRFADDRYDTLEEKYMVMIEDSQGYDLIFKRIKVTHPLDDVAISVFAVNDKIKQQVDVKEYSKTV